MGPLQPASPFCHVPGCWLCGTTRSASACVRVYFSSVVLFPDVWWWTGARAGWCVWLNTTTGASFKWPGCCAQRTRSGGGSGFMKTMTSSWPVLHRHVPHMTWSCPSSAMSRPRTCCPWFQFNCQTPVGITSQEQRQRRPIARCGCSYDAATAIAKNATSTSRCMPPHHVQQHRRSQLRQARVAPRYK